MINETQKQEIWYNTVSNYDNSKLTDVFNLFSKQLKVIEKFKPLIYNSFYKIHHEYLEKLLRSLNFFYENVDLPVFCFAMEIMSLMLFHKNHEIYKHIDKNISPLDILPMLYILDVNTQQDFNFKSKFMSSYVSQNLCDAMYRANLSRYLNTDKINYFADFPYNRSELADSVVTLILCYSILDEEVYYVAIKDNKPLFLYLEERHKKVLEKINPEIPKLLDRICLEYSWMKSSVNTSST